MKLSFSLGKAPPPKKKIEIHAQDIHQPIRNQVVAVSSEGVIKVEKKESNGSENPVDLIIPVQSMYTRRVRGAKTTSSIDHDALVKSQHKPGIIAGGKRAELGQVMFVENPIPPKRRQTGSILMQIRAARESGKIHDAPDVSNRSLDPEQFGWALLRGMGYDGTKDEPSDVPQSVIRNNGRLGLGVKYDPKK